MDSEDDCVYLYLDFNDKLAPCINSNEIFLRVSNLHKPNPLVQINDLIFKGSYEECVGSNIFFEEILDPPATLNVFEKETAIRLRPILTQTKIVNLQQMKLLKTFKSTKDEEENSVEIDLKQPYPQVLEKLEQGLISLEDLPSRESDIGNKKDCSSLRIEQQLNYVTQSGTSQPHISMPYASYEVESEMESCVNEKTNRSSDLEIKYEKLKRLAGKPVRRMRSPERVEECPPHLKDNYEYHNLECQILQNSDAFRTVSSSMVGKSLAGGVDLDRCVLNGMITSSNKTSNFPDLSPDELNSVLSIDNFENLSLPARYLVLKECLAKMEALIEETSPEGLEETDGNGRTVEMISDIFRKLVAALERQISQSSEGLHLKPASPRYENEDVYIKYKPSQGDRISVECPELFSDAEIAYGNQDENIEEDNSAPENDDERAQSEEIEDDSEDETYTPK